MAHLYIGTCSWKYDSWKDLVYSNNPNINYLKEYSAQFNTVEIDQWFWSLGSANKVKLPNKNVVEAYNLSVPKDFKFTIKVPNSLTLTHHYKKKKNDPLVKNNFFLNPDLFDQFLYTTGSIADKIGTLMFQFEYLNKEKMPNQDIFLENLDKFLSNIDNKIKIAVEIRNPNYLNKDYFEFLKANQISNVFLQGYYMPPIWEVFEKYSEYLVSPVIIRLHGPDRSGIEEKSGGIWNQIIEPKDDELAKIIKIIEKLLAKETDIYLNVNNHYEGSAPLTINKIRELLRT